MSTPSNNPEERRPSDELGPQLRNDVEKVLDEPVPKELMRHTLDRVRQQRPPVQRISNRSNRSKLVIAMAAMAAAASLAGVAFWMTTGWRSDSSGRLVEAPPSGRSTEDAPKSIDEFGSRPTMWAYLEVLREDPESLDDLLDAHASRLGNADPASLRMGIPFSSEGPTGDA